MRIRAFRFGQVFEFAAAAHFAGSITILLRAPLIRIFSCVIWRLSNLNTFLSYSAFFNENAAIILFLHQYETFLLPFPHFAKLFIHFIKF